MTTCYRAAKVIPAKIESIFERLANPAEHRRFDASGMVGQPVGAERLDRTGQVFVMNMTYRDGDHVEHYRSDNHVTVLERPHAIAWTTATAGGEPLGWVWRYDLEPVPDGTRVALSYDWSAASEENRSRFGAPLVDEADLAESLRLLEISLEIKD